MKRWLLLVLIIPILSLVAIATYADSSSAGMIDTHINYNGVGYDITYSDEGEVYGYASVNSYDSTPTSSTLTVVSEVPVTINDTEYKFQVIGVIYIYCEDATVLELPANLSNIDATGIDMKDLERVVIPADDYLFSTDVIDGAITERRFNGTYSLLYYPPMKKDTEFNDTENVIYSIYMSAFKDNVYLEKVYISKTVNLIGVGAFQNCTSLNEFICDADNANYCVSNGYLLNTASNTIIAFPAASDITDVQIDASTVGSYAFYNCTKIEMVHCSSALNTISKCAFDGCSNLTMVLFPESTNLTIIGEYAFANCSSLVDAPTYYARIISSGAFQYCVSLDCLFLGPNLAYIGDVVIAGCYNIDYIYCDELTAASYLSYNGILCKADKIGNPSEIVCVPPNWTIEDDLVTEFTTPETISYVDPYAFDNSRIEKLTISAGLSEVSPFAFSYMKSLKEVVISNDTFTIAEYAFEGCYKLESVTLGGVINILDGAFEGCISLNTIDITPNVKSIGDDVFEKTGLVSVTIPSTVQNVGAYVFEGCSNLELVVVNQENTKFDSHAFYIGTEQNVTVKGYHSNIDITTEYASENVHFEFLDDYYFPIMNIVGIIVCLIILAGITMYLRRI